MKISNWIGLGTNNLVKVKTDSEGRMIPKELERELVSALQRGMVPFCVNATAGTTILGAIDPLDRIADICEKYHVWMHVDVRYEIHLIFI